FDQRGMKCFRFLLQVGGNFAGDVLGADGVVFPENRLHLDEIDYTFELVFLSDWNLDRDRLGIEAFAEGIDGVLEIGAHLINLVDEANSRNAVFVSLPPDLFRLRLHSMDSVKYCDSTIEYAQ